MQSCGFWQDYGYADVNSLLCNHVMEPEVQQENTELFREFLIRIPRFIRQSQKVERTEIEAVRLAFPFGSHRRDGELQLNLMARQLKK